MNAGPSREPWWKAKVGLRRSPKMAALPNDSARLGWVYVLGEAKLQPRMGAFLDRKALVELMGRYGRYFDDWVCVGLAEIAPELCARCAAKHPDAAKGEVIVHDYRREQMDPSNADRQAAWREAHAAPKRPERNGNHNGAITAPRVTPEAETVTPNVTADSRARGTTVTETETERGESQTPTAVPARDGSGSRERQPRLTKEQLAAWATFDAKEWGPFKAAWMGRGFLLPPFGESGDDPGTSQRTRLWRIAEARPTALGEWVATAPGRKARDVIAYVFEQWAKIEEDVADVEAQTVAEQDEAKADRHPLERLGDVLANMDFARDLKAKAS